MAQFAFLQFPDSPVEPVEGWAQIAGNEARAPRIEVRNRSAKPVRYVEIGWVVKDRDGQAVHGRRRCRLRSRPVPAAGPHGRVLQDTTLRFTPQCRASRCPSQGMTGFVSQVEFADGKVWVPNRQNLINAQPAAACWRPRPKSSA